MGGVRQGKVGLGNPYIGRVNQKLIFARHQLELRIELSEEGQPLSANERIRNQGILDAGIWHLNGAYRAYIAEVAANYRLANPEKPNTARELSSALEAINKHPAEAQELQRLEEDGFVRDMLHALENIEQVKAELPEKVQDSSNPDPLALREVTEIQGSIQVDFACFSQWIAEFKGLVSRHREHMLEY